MPTKPLPYQREGILRIEQAGRRTLLADEMGLGKTLQALWVMRRSPDCFPAVVVCPAMVKYAWQLQAAVHTGLRANVLEGQKPPTRRAIFTGNLFVLNYDILQHWLPWLNKLKPKMLILDECQNLTNPRTIRTKAARTLARSCPYVLAMSGTPLQNRPAELYPILNMIWPGVFDSFIDYATLYCKPTRRPWGMEYKGATRLPELNRRLTGLGMIRRLKADVLKELPEQITQVTPTTLKDQEQYDEAKADFHKWLRRHHPERYSAATRAEELSQMGYLLKLVARLKMPAIAAWIDAYLRDTEEKLVVFAHHRALVAALHKRYLKTSVVVDGGTPARDRQTAVDRFQLDPKVRVFVGNKAAIAGPTLTAATNVLFVEMYWRGTDHAQAAARLHRIGQHQTTWAHYLIARGTIEEYMCEIVQRKMGIVTGVLDGRAVDTTLSVHDLLLERLREEGKTICKNKNGRALQR